MLSMSTRKKPHIGDINWYKYFFFVKYIMMLNCLNKVIKIKFKNNKKVNKKTLFHSTMKKKKLLEDLFNNEEEEVNVDQRKIFENE